MSYYYNYYIGYKSGGKFYPLGPYDAFGHIHPAVWKSSSYASDLHRSFQRLNNKDYSDELRNTFSYTNYRGEEEVVDVKFLPWHELPSDSYIKRGYFLIEDVFAYEKDSYAEDIFHDYLTEFEYAALLKRELAFGKQEPRVDCEGNPIEVHSPSDYIYYAYVDSESEEYEAFLIRNACESLKYSGEIPADAEFVVLETEG